MAITIAPKWICGSKRSRFVFTTHSLTGPYHLKSGHALAVMNLMAGGESRMHRRKGCGARPRGYSLSGNRP